MVKDSMRLALRVEGDWWVAYIARLDTMEGALELGRVRMRLVGIASQKAAALDFFKGAMSATLQAAGGHDLSWPTGPTPAPEHERAGSA